MKWIDRFPASIERFAGATVKEKVMAGSEKLESDTFSEEVAKWVKGAMDRLNALVDEETRKKIMMNTCPHVYPKERIQELRALYKRLGNIDELLKIMCNDRSYEGTSFYDHPVRKGNIVYITKVPFNPNAYQNATNEDEKRLAYCHCPLVKENKMRISSIICYCGSGWDKQLWEGILEKPVQVEVAKSIIQGDNCCVHAIHLPPETVRNAQ